jgi:hypothetical protein
MISLAETTAEPSEKGAIVKVDGDFFCEYVSLFRHMPCIWPIHGPTNQPMTRAWPLAERGEHEEIDHPHHHSFWFTHERVNGRNFWLEPDSGHPSADSNIVMKQTDLEIVSASGEEAVIRTTNDWMADGEVVVSDVRTLTFSGDSDQRSIDFAITLKAPESHEVKFADIKDGTFSIRVAGTMKPTARMGGKIVNSEGQVDDDAWGQVAKWIDCSGPVVDEAGNSETVGVTLLSHPSNVRHPTRWHARTYGLITAAPFGEQPFPNPRQGLGGYTIPAGGELKLRYKAIFHRGALDEATAAEEYEAFAADGE